MPTNSGGTLSNPNGAFGAPIDNYEGPSTGLFADRPDITEVGPGYIYITTDTSANYIAGQDGTWLELAQSGTSVVGLGDYINFKRAGALDVTSGSFDYVADQLHVSGTSVAVDDSAGWIADFGWPVPQVLLDGVYTILSSSASGGGGTTGISIYDPSGVVITPWNDGPITPMFFETGNGVMGGWTLYLPANTHISMDQAGPDPTTIFLMIQKVG